MAGVWMRAGAGQTEVKQWSNQLTMVKPLAGVVD
jgi:hypothetical protein